MVVATPVQPSNLTPQIGNIFKYCNRKTEYAEFIFACLPETFLIGSLALIGGF
jgi:hypothetical protein